MELKKWVRLSDVCDITTGKLDANNAVDGGKYPFFTCAPEPLAIDEFAFDDDVILLAGNNANGTFHIQRYHGKFNAYQRTYVLAAKDGYNIDYIYYSLKLSLVQFQKASQGSQTKFLTKLILNSFQIRNLPFDIQTKLSSVLRCIDDKISNNNSINSELESLAKTIYDYWFLQFEFPNEEGLPYKSSGGKMVWSEELKREIPEGWEVKNIRAVCDIVDCLHSKKPDYSFEDENYYLLQLENLTSSGYIDLSEKYFITKEDYLNWTSKIEIQENDFVITNAGRTGAVGMIPAGVRCALGRNFTAIRPTKINPYYLRMFLQSSYMEMQVKSNLDSGAFFKSFNVKSIKEIQVLIPGQKILERASDIFSYLVKKIELELSENRELADLRDWLLPMLMNGQVGFKEEAT